MYYFIQKLHSGWAYLVILLLFIAVVNAAFGKNREFTTKDKKIALFALIATHLQLVIGFFLYFVSPLGLKSFGKMKDAPLRLTSLEHPVVVIFAIVLITIGWIKHKKATTSQSKFKAIQIFYAIGLVLILSRLPWKLWF